MVNQGLVTFIRTSLEQGHDAYSVRNHLIRSGYKATDINEAFNVVYNKHDTRFPKKWLIIIGVLLLLILCVFALVMVINSSEGKGGPADIIEPVIFPEPDTRGNCFDGILNNGEKEVDCGGDCKPCITHTLPGESDLGSEDPDPIEPGPVDDEPVFVPGARPSWEILNEIHEIALSDPEKAAKECADVAKQDTRDSCYLDIAQVTKNEGNCKLIQDDFTKDGCYQRIASKAKDSSICQKVADANSRDTCYMDFILDGDHELCDHIQTEYYTSACAILRD